MIGPAAVLVLVIGVLVVLAVAAVALVLDARRRRARQAPPPPPPRPPAPRRQTEPIDSARAQVDPPTVMTRSDRVPPPEQDGGTRQGR
ncbi:hypothetical protein [Pseudonocardia broussonetiae]|uniref:Uncharacterized protein n=1 Tax=Pseudonocardia broussonetiae TaxID=2736640 RepID=A0A6M6JRM4_9PSEU|nr:hypothetical protein [Pseudonocardia broussonetiae]QJY49863.1 hypothetical protein HOP40_32260 [Pseudonocardia broussonetiae]